MRNAPPPELAAFDLPDGISVTGRRKITTLPTHALFLLNSPLVVEQSRVLADAINTTTNVDAAIRIRAIYERVFQRMPTTKELRRAMDYLGQDQKNWPALCQALFISNEFRYID